MDDGWPSRWMTIVVWFDHCVSVALDRSQRNRWAAVAYRESVAMGWSVAVGRML